MKQVLHIFDRSTQYRTLTEGEERKSPRGLHACIDDAATSPAYTRFNCRHVVSQASKAPRKLLGRGPGQCSRTRTA